MKSTNTGKLILAGLATMSLVALFALPSSAVGATGASSTQGDTIEPINVKADAQVYSGLPGSRTTNLQEGNIKSFTLGGDGASITASITTEAPLVRCPTPTTCASVVQSPYGGVHVMVLFQTEQLNVAGPIGCADIACTGQSGWTPTHPDDRFYWFLYYGATVSEVQEDLALGTYDPAGRIVGAPLEPGVGQIFRVMGQHYTVCSDAFVGAGTTADMPNGRSNNVTDPVFSNGGKTVTLSFPYEYKWRNAPAGSFPCGLRHKVIATGSTTVKNAVAFSWADHEIGGPDPIGLIIGWTWYLDSVPDLQSGTGYKVGTPSGDPNPSSFAGPKCAFVTRGVGPIPPTQRNPLYDGTPCMTPNPIGPGFSASGLNFAA